MESKLVSIFIPAYNQEQLIEKCVRSALNQTYNNVEVVVVDDGSTDNTGAILDTIANEDNRLKVIHQKNKGIGGATNCALDNVTGDFITSLDSDDYIAPEMIQVLMNAISTYNVDIAQCDRYRFVSKNGIPFTKQHNDYRLMTREEVLSEFFNDGVTGRNMEARLYKREIWDGIRCPEGRQIIDVVTAPRLLNRCKNYVYLTGKYYYNFQTPNSMSRGDFTEARWSDYLYANDFFIKFIKENCPSHQDYISYRIIEGSLKNTIAVKRSVSIVNKKEKLLRMHDDFLKYFDEYKNTKYYKQQGVIYKAQLYIYKMSPGCYNVIFNKVSKFLKKMVIIPIKKLFGK